MGHKESENCHEYERIISIRSREIRQDSKRKKHGKGETVLEAQNLERARYDWRTVKINRFG